MSPSSIGVVRGLAAALGVGAAVMAGGGIAAADAGSADSSRSEKPAARSSESGPARGSLTGGRTPRAAAPVARGNAPRGAATVAPGSRASGESRTAPTIPDVVARAQRPMKRVTPPPTVPDSEPVGEVAAADSTAIGTGLPSPAAAAAPAPASSSPMPLSALRTQPAMRPEPLTTATVVALGLTNFLHMSIVLAASALSPAPPGPLTATPVVHLNGLDLVAASQEEITSLYGRWAYPPGAPGFIQGRQTFDAVDPKTGGVVGTFDALVSRGNGIPYTELLVTSNGGGQIGADAGQVPPVGSLISSLQLGLISLSYSSLPTPSGNRVRFTIRTPFREVSLPIWLDAANGIADRTVDNRPMDLGNGYFIAPADPNGETITATSGFLPLFTTVQGNQTFSVYDSEGRSVGTFDALFTTTKDLAIFYTQALMVTANDGVNVGTGPGQVPPVGSVYNVMYAGTDKFSFLYSALPSSSGDDISVIAVIGCLVTRSALTLVNALEPPEMKLSAAGGYEFVPVSELQPSGINGLPPRDVQLQGYQQFDVYDSAGARIGTVDADVFSQWDAFGIRSKALMITNVTDGGSDVPPAGSVFNFVTSGDSGFGAAHSTVPWPSGNLTSYKLVTPRGDIPLPSTLIPVTTRTPVSFFTPFGGG